MTNNKICEDDKNTFFLNFDEYGKRWYSVSSSNVHSRIYDPSNKIESVYKITNKSSNRYELLWNPSLSCELNEIIIEPKLSLWIEIKEDHSDNCLVYFKNNTIIEELTRSNTVRLGHNNLIEKTISHELSIDTNILGGAEIKDCNDNLNANLIANEDKITVLAQIQINKFKTDSNNNSFCDSNNNSFGDPINYFWMKIDGECQIRLYHAYINCIGTITDLVLKDGMTPIKNVEDGVIINVNCKNDFWAKVEIENINIDREYETIIVAIEGGSKYNKGSQNVKITYTLDGPE